MPYIPQIKIGETIYDLKDSGARSSITNLETNILELENALAHTIVNKSSLEQGAFGRDSGKTSSDYRIRLITPIVAKKGTAIIFVDGSLYHMVWEMSSDSTSGGNIIASNSWNNQRMYVVQNDCYIMLSFSKTSSGATTTITVDDFESEFYVEIQRATESAVIYTTDQNLSNTEKKQAVANIESVNAQELRGMFLRNLLDTSLYKNGIYYHISASHAPGDIGPSDTTKYLPRIRINSGVPYTFKNVYAYFCPIVYDDGTTDHLSENPTPATQSVNLTPVKNGYVYVTINGGYENSAMIVEGTLNYSSPYFKGYTGGITRFPITLNSSNYQMFLPDWNSAPSNSVYSIISTPSMLSKNGGAWSDVPLPLYYRQCELVLETIGSTSSAGCIQICTIANMAPQIYVRWLNNVGGVNVWTAFDDVGPSRNTSIVIDINGNGDFISFTEGINYATQFNGAHVYVMPGTYDIIDEYKTLYGSDFFNNYNSSSTDRGIKLWNDVIVEFAPNAYLVCNYTGNNTYVQNLFSPLNSGSYGFTLINCNLIDHNVRYSMHDERGGQTDYYHNKYIGCHFNHDKGTGTGYIQAIGGGLGKNGLIEIENCVFESATSTEGIVSWHNSSADGARSQIFIRDSFVKGRVRFSWYGPEDTLVSTMMITGCKMYDEPFTTRENTDYNNINVEIIAWNNVIETPN